jgi:drug/metabolite transporter (DMT)-like permease
LFDEKMSAAMILGIAIIIAAGLYILLHKPRTSASEA